MKNHGRIPEADQARQASHPGPTFQSPLAFSDGGLFNMIRGSVNSRGLSLMKDRISPASRPGFERPASNDGPRKRTSAPCSPVGVCLPVVDGRCEG